MKALKKTLLILAINIVILVPAGLYFYTLAVHPVEILNEQYPLVTEVKPGEVKISFQKKRPPYWADLKEISQFAKWAIIFSEDWSFYQHDGVDVNQIKIALEEMVEDNRFRGASTISQQMIKNVFLSEERTLSRKLNEYILVREAEQVLTKDKILEVYLNCIEFGPSIYGIRNAAKHYFRKSPASLTPREGAFLAMLLPSPKRYYVSFKKKKLTPFAQERIRSVLGKMRMGKVISKERFEEEVSTPFSWENP